MKWSGEPEEYSFPSSAFVLWKTSVDLETSFWQDFFCKIPVQVNGHHKCSVVHTNGYFGYSREGCSLWSIKRSAGEVLITMVNGLLSAVTFTASLSAAAVTNIKFGILRLAVDLGKDTISIRRWCLPSHACRYCIYSQGNIGSASQILYGTFPWFKCRQAIGKLSYPQEHWATNKNVFASDANEVMVTPQNLADWAKVKADR